MFNNQQQKEELTNAQPLEGPWEITHSDSGVSAESVKKPKSRWLFWPLKERTKGRRGKREAVQGELNLDSVEPICNDLKESDLDVVIKTGSPHKQRSNPFVPRKTSAPDQGVNGRETEVDEARDTEPVTAGKGAPLWGRLAGRLFRK